jgi:D-serine deaminase-like pyridoxal phosphate-dependent protein
VTGRTRLQGAVGALRERPLPATGKGLGLLTAAGPVTTASLAARRPSLFGPELAMPLLVLKQDALAHNIGAMARYCAEAGVQLAPHGKTTMAPQIVARQIEAGAWGVTAATISQVQVFREFGVERVLLANELTEPAAVGWLAAELAADPGFDCYVYADSLDGVRLLADGMQAGAVTGPARSAPAGGARPLPVLVELGQRGGRTGCRSAGQAEAVASAVTAAPGLRLAGVAGYEGSIGHDREPATVAEVAAFCRELRALAARLPPPEARGGAGGADQYLVTAGGSLYFDIVVAELTAPAGLGPAPTVVLRSGAYVTHDHGIYARLTPAAQPGGTGPALVPALELWARVLSAPEPGLAIAGAGRRDAPFDQGLPVPLRIRRPDGQEGDAAGLRVTALDDQHAYLQLPAGCELRPGDLVCLGISHPCTAFDKWQLIPVVDEDYRVTDVVRTFF